MQKRDHGTGHDVRGGVTGCSLLDSAFSMLMNHQCSSKRQLYREKGARTPPDSAGFKSYRSQRHFRTPVTHFRSGSAYSYAPHPAGEAALAAPLPGCAEYSVNARPSLQERSRPLLPLHRVLLAPASDRTPCVVRTRWDSAIPPSCHAGASPLDAVPTDQGDRYTAHNYQAKK